MPHAARMKTRFLLAMAAGVLGVAGLAAQEAKTPAFVERMNYWVRDGGEWRCANPDYKPGTDQAKEYGYKFTWALHKRAVTLEIFGDFDNGRRITFWHNLSSWHPVEKRVVMTHLSVGGAVLHGWEETPDADTRAHEFKGVGPDGSEMRFRDIARVTGPDTHESTSFAWENGKWVEQRKMQWRRVKPVGWGLEEGKF